MSTLHTSNRYYHPSEFDAPVRRGGVHVPIWVAVGLVGCVAFASLHAGAWMERQVTPEPEVRFVTINTRPPLTQWNCDGRERAEYLEACKQRARSALTKPKELRNAP